MIEERTKFRNGWDKSKYYHDLVLEYLKLSPSSSGTGLSRLNVTLLREINECLDKCSDCRRILMVLSLFFAELGVDNYRRCVVTLIGSIKSQSGLVFAVKGRLKEVPIIPKYVPALRNSISILTSRVERCLDSTQRGLISLTALSAYPGDIYADILEVCSNVEYTQTLCDPSVLSFVKSTVACLPEHGDWEAKAQHYGEFQNRQREAARQRASERENEDLQFLKDLALYVLCKTSDTVYAEYTNRFRCVHHTEIARLKTLTQDMQSPKIVLLAHIRKGSTPIPYYYCDTNSSCKTRSLSQATVIENFEELPTKLQDEIELGKLISLELLLE